MPMLDPRRLLTFREVARRGSFSRAAEALALTQPAVSQQVAALEREVGTELLRRGPGGPALTETGELLLAHADALSDRLRAADAQLAALAEDTWTAPSREHLVRRACVAAGFEPRIDYVTRDPLAIGGLISAGLAVSLTPRLLAGRLEGVHTI